MLVLVGSGEYLPGMESVDRALLDRLGEPPRVVCLPTAAGTEGTDRIKYWDRLGVEHFSRLGVPVQTVRVLKRADAENPALAEDVAQANFVYLSGGRPDHLFKTLTDTPVWAAIKGVLDRGGILAGCSAGAMVQGEKMFAFPGWQPAFGLISGTAIIPHFDELPGPMRSTMRFFTDSSLTVLGVDGYTAMVVDGPDQVEVLGRGTVTVWNKGGKTAYPQGSVPDWRAKP